MNSFNIDENILLILPQLGDSKTVQRNDAEFKPIGLEEISDLVKQIEYQKPNHTKIRIGEAFLEELKSFGLIQYSSDVSMTGLRMVIDNSVSTYKFE